MDKYRAIMAAWRAKNPDKVRAYAAKRYAKIKEERAKNPNRKKRDPNLRRKLTLKKFGITIVEFASMLNAQGGVCAICRKPNVESSTRGHPHVRSLCVDHDHVTGRIRGLLCGPCNKALGLLQEDPRLVRAALIYMLSGGVPGAVQKKVQKKAA